MSPVGTKRTSGDVRYLVANGGKAVNALRSSKFWGMADKIYS